MKRKKKKQVYCFVNMKDEELMLYTPDFYQTKEEALKALMEDCNDIAEHNGYKKEQLFMHGIDLLKNKVTFIWDHWSELEEEDGPDNEEGTSTDN